MPRTSVVAGFINDNAGGGGPALPQYYVELTVSSSQVGSNLTDFPVYVDLSDMPAGFFTNVQSDGGDIEVTESDGVTKCPVDLVGIDTSASIGELHFLASSLSATSDTTFRIYYGTDGTSTQPAVDDPYGRNAVWTDYAGVWHFDENPSGTAPQMVDSTGNGNDLTTAGSMTSGDSVAGKLAGNAVDFDGTDDYAENASPASALETLSIDATWTVSAWVRPDADSLQAIAGVVAFDTPDQEYGILVAGTNEFSSLARDGTTATQVKAAAGVSTTGVWYHLVGGGDGADVQLYVDGSFENSGTHSSITPDTSGDPFRVANPVGVNSGSFLFNGRIDEVRARVDWVGADWISAEYTNQNTPNTFYSISAEQAV